jgi:diacylglycerol kinase (ATP)
MITFFCSRAASFRNAFSGWWYVIRTQKNAWIHAMFNVVVILVSFLLKINRLEWGLIIFAIALVWTAEFINTALEAVVDLASHQEHHHLAKIGKDVGAAAVLISACSAAIIGFLVLGPHLWRLIVAWLK